LLLSSRIRGGVDLLFDSAILTSQDITTQMSKAHAQEERLLAFDLSFAPEELQGAWELESEGMNPARRILYITVAEHYYANSIDTASSWNPSHTNGNRFIRYHRLAIGEWSYIAAAIPGIWCEGRIRALDDRIIEVREWRLDSDDNSDRGETVLRYRRILPRPGPYLWDFIASKRGMTPPPLHGTWVSEGPDGSAVRLTFEPTKVGSPLCIRFEYSGNTIGDPKTHEIKWVGGDLIPWGSGRWWLRTGPKGQKIQISFELSTEGQLLITYASPPKNSDSFNGQHPLPRIFNRPQAATTKK
jgi:hypothetical protein